MDISAKTLDVISKKIAGKFKGHFKTQVSKPVIVNQPKIETVVELTTITPPVVEETPVVVQAVVETTVIDVVNTPELVPVPAIDENATAVQLINNTNQ